MNHETTRYNNADYIIVFHTSVNEVSVISFKEWSKKTHEDSMSFRKPTLKELEIELKYCEKNGLDITKAVIMSLINDIEERW